MLVKVLDTLTAELADELTGVADEIRVDESPAEDAIEFPVDAEYDDGCHGLG